MKSLNIDRRTFIKASALSAAALTIAPMVTLGNITAPIQNKLPRWKGFNLLDFFSPAEGSDFTNTTDDDFKWMADWGFDFVRIPMAYPRYLKIDRTKDITPEDVYKFDDAVIESVEKLVYMANSHGLHVSLNLHRGPGYCINAGFHEPFNLWKDKEAADAFNAHWSMWAKRFKTVSPKMLSFDLLNEPAYIEDMNDQFAHKSLVPGETYHRVAAGAVNAIREISRDRLIVADGNGGGNNVIPELTDLGLSQSCRGYWPHLISHYQAPWVFKNPADAPEPHWPGEMEGKQYGRQQLEEVYKPWIELMKSGTGVHCGECGCWRNTPHDIFLRWFEDVISILTENSIGYALWNFRGDFGILDSGRADVKYTDWNGHKLDSKLLALLKKY